MTAALIILGLCIFFEGLFSGSELALVAADKVKLRHIADSGGRRAKAIANFLEDPGELISTALVGTNICVVLSTVVTTLTLLRWFPGQAELLSLAVMTPLVLIFGEIVPKSLFQNRADALAPGAIYALWFFRMLVFPVVSAGSWLSRVFLRRMGLEERQALMSRQELRLLLRLPSREGVDRITPEERRMITRIFSFKNKTVEEVMLPLSEVTAMPVNTTMEELAQEIAEKQHTRIPLFEERVDQIVGIVHAFEVLGAVAGAQPCDLCRPAIFVPESQLAVDTLVRLQREGQGIAVVVDEYGGATGIVSIEDILEEVVGEIEDEYDEEEQDFLQREPNGSFRVTGRAPVARINEVLKINLPLGEDYESLAGLVLDRMRRIPAEGESVVIEGVTIEILVATERSIEEMRLWTSRKKAQQGKTR